MTVRGTYARGRIASVLDSRVLTASQRALDELGRGGDVVAGGARSSAQGSPDDMLTEGGSFGFRSGKKHGVVAAGKNACHGQGIINGKLTWRGCFRGAGPSATICHRDGR